jgi:hypothetical protein
VRFGGRLFLYFLALGILWAEQPLPFSHKLHAGTMKLPCKTCHPSPDPGEMMTIAPLKACMQCHTKWEDRAIQWVRIYQIPSYVEFSHRAHIKGGAACEDCHGKVQEREQLTKEGDISMGACMKCHQTRKVSIDCAFCHDPR